MHDGVVNGDLVDRKCQVTAPLRPKPVRLCIASLGRSMGVKSSAEPAKKARLLYMLLPAGRSGRPYGGPLAPLPMDPRAPYEGMLTVYSSGCTAFGHPARPSRAALPIKTGRDLAGRRWFAASRLCVARISQPMFLWTTTAGREAIASRERTAAILTPLSPESKTAGWRRPLGKAGNGFPIRACAQRHRIWSRIPEGPKGHSERSGSTLD